MEGHCHSDYGYIIQIADVESYGKSGKETFFISVPEVTEEGCVVEVTFSAICFKGTPGFS